MLTYAKNQAFNGLVRVMEVLRSGAVPDFIIVGAQKSGTTSLLAMLAEHPRVTASFRKEVHYFDMRWERSSHWYEANFPPVKLFSFVSKEEAVVGEASPSYLFFPDCAERIHSIYPSMKIIAILRDPVSRAISHYYHNRRHVPDLEPETFEKALELEDSRIALALSNFSEANTLEREAVARYSYKARGVYVDQIRRFEQYFGVEKIKVVCFEEFIGNPDDVHASLFRFLGLKTVPVGLQLKNASAYPLVDNHTVERLALYFGDKNEELFSHIGRRFPWV